MTIAFSCGGSGLLGGGSAFGGGGDGGSTLATGGDGAGGGGGAGSTLRAGSGVIGTVATFDAGAPTVAWGVAVELVLEGATAAEGAVAGTPAMESIVRTGLSSASSSSAFPDVDVAAATDGPLAPPPFRTGVGLRAASFFGGVTFFIGAGLLDAPRGGGPADAVAVADFAGSGAAGFSGGFSGAFSGGIVSPADSHFVMGSSNFSLSADATFFFGPAPQPASTVLSAKVRAMARTTALRRSPTAGGIQVA